MVMQAQKQRDRDNSYNWPFRIFCCTSL